MVVVVVEDGRDEVTARGRRIATNSSTLISTRCDTDAVALRFILPKSDDKRCAYNT